MLNSFRRGGLVQGLMGAVILIIIAAFALDFRGRSSKFNKECVVSVDGECVPPRDFNAAFQLSVRQDLTPKQIKQLKIRKMLLDGLVERELLVRDAKRLGVSISEEAVDAELALGRFHYSMPVERDSQLPMLTYVNVQDPKTEAFDYEVYQRVVRSYARMSTKDFKVHQTEELIASRMRELIKNGVQLSDSEVYSQYEATRGKATVRVAQISSAWFARFLTSLSDEAVQKFATEHAAEVDAAFAEKEATYAENCPLVSEIFFAFPPAADADDEAATRTRAEQVAARAAKASSAEFERLARIYSAAPSANYGGKRGCLQESEGEDAAQLFKAVEGLAPGAVSALAPAPRGVWLLRLEKRLAKEELASVGRLWVARPLAVQAHADGLTLEFAKGLLATLPHRPTMQDAVDVVTANALLLVPDSANARAAGKAPAPSELQTAAKESRDRPQIDVSPSFSRLTGINPIANAGPNAKQLAFSLKEIDEVYPDPIPTRDGLAILQLKDKEPVTPEAYAADKAEFVRELRERAQSDALNAYVSRLRQAHANDIVIDQRFLEQKDNAANDS